MRHQMKNEPKRQKRDLEAHKTRQKASELLKEGCKTDFILDSTGISRGTPFCLGKAHEANDEERLKKLMNLANNRAGRRLV